MTVFWLLRSKQPAPHPTPRPRGARPTRHAPVPCPGPSLRPLPGPTPCELRMSRFRGGRSGVLTPCPRQHHLLPGLCWLLPSGNPTPQEEPDYGVMP